MIEQKALICTCCGGTINPRTMKCEYCDTSYRRHVDGIIEYRRPGEDCLTSSFSIDRHALRDEGAPLMRHCLNEMAHKMAEQLLPYCEFDSRYDIETDRILLRSRLRVVRSGGPSVIDMDDVVNGIMDDPFGYRF